MTVRCAVLGVLLVALAPSSATAQKKPPTAAALADEGKRLLAEGQIAEACARLRASLERRALLTVRLRLVDCLEKDGRIASAHAELVVAAAQARRIGDRRGVEVRRRLAALTPRLPRLLVRYAPGAVRTDLELGLDGKPLDTAAAEQGLILDPGRHQVTATAPGMQTVAANVDAVEGKTVTVEVPVLLPARPTRMTPVPASAAKPPRGAAAAPRSPAPRRSGRRTLGVVVGASGVAAVATGLALGLVAKNTFDGAKDDGLCDADVVCTPAGADRVNRARTFGNVATVAVGVGLAAVATGAVLYLTAPRADARLAVTPPVGGPAMITWTSRF